MHVPSYTFSLKFRRGLALAVPSFLRYCCARSLACSPTTSGTPLPGTYAKKPNAGGEGVADGSKLAWFILVQGKTGRGAVIAKRRTKLGDMSS